jgi:hypothetical protein
MSVRKIIAVTGLMAVLVVGATPALATTTTNTATSSTGDRERLNQRLDLACARVPNLTTRVENVLARLKGDANTVGSIAWLEVKGEQARQNGRGQLAELIENRIAVRTERIDVLEIRLDNLAEAAAACAARS